jgi:hypothetical protein
MTGRDTDWAAAVYPQLVIDTDPLSGPVARYPGVQVSQGVAHGHPGRALAGLSARAGLTILGGRAPHGPGLRGAGTVTHAVLNHAHGPVPRPGRSLGGSHEREIPVPAPRSRRHHPARRSMTSSDSRTRRTRAGPAAARPGRSCG